MISKVAQFFGFGMSREDLDGQTIVELNEENLYLRDLFEEIRRDSLPHGDGGWGFDSGERGDDPEVIAAAVHRMFLAWRDNWDAAQRLLTVGDELVAMYEQNGVLTEEVARLKAEAVLPEELHKDHVPQLAIETRKPRKFDSWDEVPEGIVVEDSDDMYLKKESGQVYVRDVDSNEDWREWGSRLQTVRPDDYGPWMEILPQPRIFNRGDIIPEDVTKLRVAGEDAVVVRGHDGEFCYNPKIGVTWGPSDTSEIGWYDEDFPLTEVLN